MRYLIFLIGIFLFAATVVNAQALRVFISSQVGTNPQNGYILSTDGTNSTWIANTGGGGGASSTVIKVNGTISNTGVPTLDFGSGITVSESPTDEFNLSVPIYLASTSPFVTGQLARVASDGTVTSIASSSLALLISDTVGTLAETRGGTNQTTYSTGDMLYASSANTLAKRAIGTTGQVLMVSGGIPTWTSTSSLGISAGSGTVYLASSSPFIVGNAAYVTGNGTIGSTATGTLTDSVTGLSFNSQIRGLLGGAAALSLDTGYSIPTTNSLLTASASTTGNLAFWSGNQTIGNVATGTLTETVTGLELNATRSLVGGSAILALTSGFVIPTTTLWTSVADFYTTPSTRITAGSNCSWAGNTLNCTDNTKLATSSPWTVGQLAFVASPGVVDSVATGTLTETVTGLSFSGTPATVGTASILSLDAGFTLASTTGLTNLYSFYDTPSTRITAGNGLVWSGNTLSTPFNGTLGTTSAPTVGQASFWQTATTVGSVATGTLTTNATGLSFDNSTRGLFGGSAILSLAAGYTIPTTTLLTSASSFFANPSSLCVSITGSAALCDGSDDGGGGGGSGLSTTTDIVGDGAASTVGFVTTDVMFGGSASTTSEFLFDKDGSKFIIASTSNTNATATIASNNLAASVQMGVASTSGSAIGRGIHWSFQSTSDVILSALGAMTNLVVRMNMYLASGYNFFIGSTKWNNGNFIDGAAIASSTVSSSTLKTVGHAGGYVLQASTTAPGGFAWVATSSLGISGSGSSLVYLATSTGWTIGQAAYVASNGAVGSVATGTLTETATGLEFNATRGLFGGSAILSLTSGYVIPTSTLWTSVSDFYQTPSTRITDGTGLTWSSNTMNCDTASGSVQGCLTGADWLTFNTKMSSSSLSTSAILANLISDETGSGALVFNGSPTFTGTSVFSSLFASASSTIGGGTIGSGLTINGGATTTLAAYFGERVGIGTTSPVIKLFVDGAIVSTESRPATSSSMTIDLSTANQHNLHLGTGTTTLSFSGLVAGQAARIVACNSSVSTSSIAWATSTSWTLLWPGGTTPTQTTTLNKCDLYTFTVTNASSTNGNMSIFGGYIQNF